jgi:hypothetical protein
VLDALGTLLDRRIVKLESRAIVTVTQDLVVLVLFVTQKGEEGSDKAGLDERLALPCEIEFL